MKNLTDEYVAKKLGCADLLLEVLAKPWLTQDHKWIEKAQAAIIEETKCDDSSASS